MSGLIEPRMACARALQERLPLAVVGVVTSGLPSRLANTQPPPFLLLPAVVLQQHDQLVWHADRRVGRAVALDALPTVTGLLAACATEAAVYRRGPAHRECLPSEREQ